MAEILAETTSSSGKPRPFGFPSPVKYCDRRGNCEMSHEFEYKQALVVRSDLKIGRGKIAVQCSHAAVSAAEDARIRFPNWWKPWLEEGQRKIALKVPDLETLLRLESTTRRNRLPVCLVLDRGLTQLPPDTATCVGIGPAPSNLVDNLTGNLSLL